MEVTYKILTLTLICICGILYLAKRYAIKRVEGFSMFPTFNHKEWVLLKKQYALEIGKVYAFYSPDGLPCMKRLDTILFHQTTGDYQLFFIGDNSEDSIDSRSYGFIDPEKVFGEIVKMRRKQ